MMFQEFSFNPLEERVIQNVNLDLKMLKTGDILVTRRWTGFPAQMMLI